jgi:hypothetical protein
VNSSKAKHRGQKKTYLDPLPHVHDVLGYSLKVCRGVVRTGDENVVILAIRGWGVERVDRDESLGVAMSRASRHGSLRFYHTHLSTMVPRSWRPGRSSRSGTDVSTMVETMAMKMFGAQTWWEAETAAM